MTFKSQQHFKLTPSGNHPSTPSIGQKNAQLFKDTPSKRSPEWVHAQLDPTSAYFQSQCYTDSITNDCFRNWTSMVHPATGEATSISPNGRHTFSEGDWSIAIWCNDQDSVFPMQQFKTIEQSLKEAEATVVTTAKHNGWTVELQYCADPKTSNRYLSIEANAPKENCEIWIEVSPFSAEGVGHIETITYLSSHQLIINQQDKVSFSQAPSNIVCGDYETCEELINGRSLEQLLQASCQQKRAGGFLAYKLSKKDTLSLTIQVETNALSNRQSIQTKNAQSQPSSLSLDTLTAAQQANVAIEPELLLSNKITVQDANIQRLLNQSDWHLSNQSDQFFNKTTSASGELELQQITIIKSLLISGRHKTAIKLLNQVETSRADSKHLATLSWMVFEFVRDDQLLKQAFPKIEGIRMSARAIKQTCIPIDDPSFSMALLALSEHESAAKIAKQLHKYDSQQRFQSVSNVIANHVYSEYQRLSKPEELSQIKQLPLHLLSLAWPLHLIDPKDDLITTLLQHIEANQFKDGLFIKRSVPSGIPTWPNACAAVVHSKNSKPQCFSAMAWLESVSLATGAWPEAVHPRTQKGCFGSGHFLPMSALYLNYVRDLFIRDSSKSLDLLPHLDKRLLPSAGQIVNLTNMPTTFGSLSLAIEAKDNAFKLTIDPSFHRQPIDVSLNFPVESTATFLNTKEPLQGAPISLSLKQGSLTVFIDPSMPDSGSNSAPTSN